MKDDIDDIMIEPNLNEKENLEPSSKGQKTKVGKAKKNVKNLKKIKRKLLNLILRNQNLIQNKKMKRKKTMKIKQNYHN